MPKLSLTKRAIETATFTGKQELLRDTNTPGFAVRISKSTKTYIVIKNHKEVTIGRCDLLPLDEARKRALQILANLTLGEPLPAAKSIGLHDYLKGWLKDTERRVSDNTFRTYKGSVNRYVTPHLGNIPLSSLETGAVKNLLDKVAKDHSSRAAQKAYSVLAKAYNDAIAEGLATTNPVSQQKKPKHVPKPIHPLTPEQSKAFLEAARGDHYYTLYVVALTTGMRLGELLGLKWSDYDGQSLQVQRAIHYIDGKRTEGTVKSKSSRRRISLTQTAIQALEAHPKHPTCPYIFYSPEGNIPCAPNFQGRSFKPILKKAGLPNIRFHDLRHSCASALLLKGVHPKVVQEILGHANIQMTLDIYSHLLPTMQAEAALKLDAIFSEVA